MPEAGVEAAKVIPEARQDKRSALLECTVARLQKTCGPREAKQSDP